MGREGDRQDLPVEPATAGQRDRGLGVEMTAHQDECLLGDASGLDLGEPCDEGVVFFGRPRRP
jgi:hypothetical protein